jgi:hypothetical protein
MEELGMHAMLKLGSSKLRGLFVVFYENGDVDQIH